MSISLSIQPRKMYLVLNDKDKYNIYNWQYLQLNTISTIDNIYNWHKRQLVAEWLWLRRGVGDGSHRTGGTPVRIHSRSETFHKVTSTRRAGNPYRFKLAHIPSNITIMITHPRPWTMSNRGNVSGIFLHSSKRCIPIFFIVLVLWEANG